MLMRSFTRREKILLLVLVLIMLVGAYVLLIQNPVNASLEKLRTEKEELELQQEVAELQRAKYHAMQAELEEIFAMPKSQLTVMPLYDNKKALLRQLNDILGDLEEYNLAFSDVAFNEKVASRSVQFTFVAPSYEEACDIIDQLTHTGNRSLMNTMAIAPAQNTTAGTWSNINTRNRDRTQAAVQSKDILVGPQQVSGTITFYESAPNMATEQSGDQG